MGRCSTPWQSTRSAEEPAGPGRAQAGTRRSRLGLAFPGIPGKCLKCPPRRSIRTGGPQESCLPPRQYGQSGLGSGSRTRSRSARMPCLTSHLSSERIPPMHFGWKPKSGAPTHTPQATTVRLLKLARNSLSDAWRSATVQPSFVRFGGPRVLRTCSSSSDAADVPRVPLSPHPARLMTSTEFPGGVWDRPRPP